MRLAHCGAARHNVLSIRLDCGVVAVLKMDHARSASPTADVVSIQFLVELLVLLPRYFRYMVSNFFFFFHSRDIASNMCQKRITHINELRGSYCP